MRESGSMERTMQTRSNIQVITYDLRLTADLQLLLQLLKRPVPEAKFGTGTSTSYFSAIGLLLRFGRDRKQEAGNDVDQMFRGRYCRQGLSFSLLVSEFLK